MKAACEEKDSLLRESFRAKGIPYPPQQVFLRAFKKDAQFEVWVHDSIKNKFVLAKEYRICAPSGDLGPKRQEGDLQVPEGFYVVDLFNPTSDYHLALRVSYPNASDSVFGNRKKLGGEIMIHGDCVTVGCIPLTDDCIKEVYWLCVLAHSNGQRDIPVHIFPTRLNETGMTYLKKAYESDNAKIRFWENLQEGYLIFEESYILPNIIVDGSGLYLYR